MAYQMKMLDKSKQKYYFIFSSTVLINLKRRTDYDYFGNGYGWCL